MTDPSFNPAPLRRFGRAFSDAATALGFFALVLIVAVVVTTAVLAVAEPIVAASYRTLDTPAATDGGLDLGDVGAP